MMEEIPLQPEYNICQSRGKVWGGRSGREELLWTDPNSPFPVPSSLHGRRQQEAEELGMKE